MGEAVLELIMSQLSTAEHRADLDVIAVVAIELHYMATPTMVGVGQSMPNNTKIILQKALESGMREVKSGHRRHRRNRYVSDVWIRMDVRKCGYPDAHRRLKDSGNARAQSRLRLGHLILPESLQVYCVHTSVDFIARGRLHGRGRFSVDGDRALWLAIKCGAL